MEGIVRPRPRELSGSYCERDNSKGELIRLKDGGSVRAVFCKNGSCADRNGRHADSETQRERFGFIDNRFLICKQYFAPNIAACPSPDREWVALPLTKQKRCISSWHP